MAIRTRWNSRFWQFVDDAAIGAAYMDIRRVSESGESFCTRSMWWVDDQVVSFLFRVARLKRGGDGRRIHRSRHRFKRICV